MQLPTYDDHHPVAARFRDFIGPGRRPHLPGPARLPLSVPRGTARSRACSGASRCCSTWDVRQVAAGRASGAFVMRRMDS